MRRGRPLPRGLLNSNGPPPRFGRPAFQADRSFLPPFRVGSGVERHGEENATEGAAPPGRWRSPDSRRVGGRPAQWRLCSWECRLPLARCKPGLLSRQNQIVESEKMILLGCLAIMLDNVETRVGADLRLRQMVPRPDCMI